MDAARKRLHARVEGRVQGVGYRFFVQAAAAPLGLSGWVRNRWDGSVEVLAEGSGAALEQLVKALWQGPRSAFVSGVQVEWSEASGEFEGFSVRRTD